MWMCVAFSGLAITIHTYMDIASIKWMQYDHNLSGHVDFSRTKTKVEESKDFELLI